MRSFSRSNFLLTLFDLAGVVELSRKRDVAEEEELSKLRAELAALQAQTSTAWSVAQHLEARDRI